MFVVDKITKSYLVWRKSRNTIKYQSVSSRRGTMWFSLGRSEGFPAQYSPNASAVHFDTLELIIIGVFVILMICFTISLPSTNQKSNIQAYSRIYIQLLIGLLILLGNFGQDWEVAVVKAKTPYKAGVSARIDAAIGVHIGLRSVNITLKSIPHQPELRGEVIDYNERFTWAWDQGNFGFGPFAGRLQQEFRTAQLRGVPIPILWIVDYFVIDGEGFRHGRFYRTAGWYCHILIWGAFSTWILALILFRSVIVYGGYCLGITGFLQLLANVVWISVKNSSPLFIPLDGEDLRTIFGSSFWIIFFNGSLCTICAVIIIVMDKKYDNHLYTYFEVDPLTSFDEISYLTPEEESVLRHKEITHDIPLIPIATSEEGEDEKIEYIPVYKKRGTVRYRQNVLPPPPVPREKKPRHLMKQIV